VWIPVGRHTSPPCKILDSVSNATICRKTLDSARLTQLRADFGQLWWRESSAHQPHGRLTKAPRPNQTLFKFICSFSELIPWTLLTPLRYVSHHSTGACSSSSDGHMDSACVDD
jgi:hypothetical protein